MKTGKLDIETAYGSHLDYILNAMSFRGPEERSGVKKKLIEYIEGSLMRRGVLKKCENNPIAIAAEIARLPVSKMADIIPASTSREGFIDQVKRAFKGEKGYIRQYAAAIKAAGPFPWAWKFDTGYPAGLSLGQAPAPADGTGGSKTLEGFIHELRVDNQLLSYLLKYNSESVLTDNSLVITASNDAARSIQNDKPRLLKSLKSYFGRDITVEITTHAPAPSQEHAQTRGTVTPPAHAGSANPMVTDTDMNHIELIMSAMEFGDQRHRDSVREDLIEYLKEVSIPLNRKREEKGEQPVLNIKKSRIFRFALIVKKARNNGDYKERSMKAFRDEPYMHTPGRAVDRINRGWSFPWKFRFKRKMVRHRHPAATATGQPSPIIETQRTEPKATEDTRTNVIPIGGQTVVQPDIGQPAAVFRCGVAGGDGCERLARVSTENRLLEKRVRALENYLVRHLHRNDNGLSCVPDDVITKEAIREAAHGGE